MKKVVVHGPGGYDALRIESASAPSAGPGEVLVKVRACGVNYADCVVRMGLYASAKKYVGWPITPGFEVAGTVAALGEGVSTLAEGDSVVAVTRFGGYATELVVPRSQVFALPDGFSHVQGASFPTVFMTADYALTELCRLRAGDRVLVHSAAGGVGSALVQIARAAGCTVVGVVGASHKVETGFANGAHYIIDKSRQDLWHEAHRLAPHGYHVIADANGVSTLRASYRHLAPTGRLVVYGFHSMLPRGRGRPSWPKLVWDWLRTPRFNPLDMTGENRSVLAFNLSYLFEEQTLLEQSMTRLMGGVADGLLRPLPVQTFPFERVAAAHEALESAQTVGKLVLIVEE